MGEGLGSTDEGKGLDDKDSYSEEKTVLKFDSGRKSFIRAIWALSFSAVFLLGFSVYFFFY